ncbi:hypothetical protein HDU84_007897 [Entophlyctis sp. JEL0112]|nr:hypothetical protein HDU84_007897 [Entophlyctis sp. JEL0112]
MEGSWNVDGKGPSVFDHSYLDPSFMPTNGRPYRSANHYTNYSEDLGYLSMLGATAYRFSVSWPRILPNCTGTVNQQAIDYYNNYIDQVRANGAEPFLTMFHWDLPQACQDQFLGFQSDEIIDAFAYYANVILTNFGSKVKYYLTLNEPRANCDFCMHRPQFPPFTTTSDDLYYKCIHNSMLAHATVVKNARAMAGSENWKFSIPSITDWIDPDPGAAATDFSSSTLMQTEWYFDPCFTGDYGSNIKAIYPLPTFTDDQKAMLNGSCDYIAVNIYNSITSGLPDEPPGETVPYTAQEVNDSTALIYWPNPRPEGTRLLPKFLYNRFHKEVVISELGYHVPRTVESTFDEAVNDDYRVQFWELNGPQLLSLINEDNVPLTAVLAWSLIDNYEFETYEFRWGHIAVDYWDPATGKVNTDKGSLKRGVKKSAYYMKEFFANYTVSPFAGDSAVSVVAADGTVTGAVQGTATGAVKTSRGPAGPAGEGTGLLVLLAVLALWMRMDADGMHKAGGWRSCGETFLSRQPAAKQQTAASLRRPTPTVPAPVTVTVTVSASCPAPVSAMFASPPASLPRRPANRLPDPREWAQWPLPRLSTSSDSPSARFGERDDADCYATDSDCFGARENTASDCDYSTGPFARKLHIKFVDDSDLEDNDTHRVKTPSIAASRENDDCDAPAAGLADDANTTDERLQNSGNSGTGSRDMDRVNDFDHAQSPQPSQETPFVSSEQTQATTASVQTSDIWLTAIDTHCAVEKLAEQIEMMHAAVCSVQDTIQESLQNNKRRLSAVIEDEEEEAGITTSSSSNQEDECFQEKECCKRLRRELEQSQATSPPMQPQALNSVRSNVAWTVGTLVAGALLGVTAVGVLF